ncbi:MAG TPA: DUF1236 domain-containing protein, partial [Pseudolabrys sp.]|nr:DUF1236 domain-containing protein [Pseudolabrys sp.]
MKSKIAIITGAALLLSAGAATAQTTIVETRGAAVPDDVVTYVERERIPSVAVDGEVVVGYPVPRTVELRPIPRDRHYSYAIIND